MGLKPHARPHMVYILARVLLSLFSSGLGSLFLFSFSLPFHASSPTPCCPFLCPLLPTPADLLFTSPQPLWHVFGFHRPDIFFPRAYYLYLLAFVSSHKGFLSKQVPSCVLQTPVSSLQTWSDSLCLLRDVVVSTFLEVFRGSQWDACFLEQQP